MILYTTFYVVLKVEKMSLLQKLDLVVKVCSYFDKKVVTQYKDILNQVLLSQSIVIFSPSKQDILYIQLGLENIQKKNLEAKWSNINPTIFNILKYIKYYKEIIIMRSISNTILIPDMILKLSLDQAIVYQNEPKSISLDHTIMRIHSQEASILEYDDIFTFHRVREYKKLYDTLTTDDLRSFVVDLKSQLNENEIEL